MSADGAVFIVLILAAVVVVVGGWVLARGTCNLGFDPARTLMPGDELRPPNPGRPAREADLDPGRSGERAGENIVESDAEIAP